MFTNPRQFLMPALLPPGAEHPHPEEVWCSAVWKVTATVMTKVLILSLMKDELICWCSLDQMEHHVAPDPSLSTASPSLCLCIPCLPSATYAASPLIFQRANNYYG